MNKFLLGLGMVLGGLIMAVFSFLCILNFLPSSTQEKISAMAQGIQDKNTVAVSSANPNKDVSKVEVKVSETNIGVIENPDFRGIKWGTSRKEILKIEGNPSIVTKRVITYGNINIIQGFDVDLLYFLNDNDQVDSAEYHFIQKHTNKIDYLKDYEVIKKVLIQKYGIPLLDKTIWKNDLYKNDPQNWGIAVAVGHLNKIASWKTDNTEIIIEIVGDNNKISLEIGYNNLNVKNVQM